MDSIDTQVDKILKKLPEPETISPEEAEDLYISMNKRTLETAIEYRRRETMSEIGAAKTVVYTSSRYKL